MHVAHNFLVIFLLQNILVSASFEVVNQFRSKSKAGASNGGGAFYAPPCPKLSLQTPASDRVRHYGNRISLSSGALILNLNCIVWLATAMFAQRDERTNYHAYSFSSNMCIFVTL